MKFIKRHLFFSLLVISTICLAYNVNDPSFLTQDFVEREIEDSLTEIDDLSSDFEITHSRNGGDNGSATLVSYIPLIPCPEYTLPKFSNSKEFSQHQPLFILYCCLKIDC